MAVHGKMLWEAASGIAFLSAGAGLSQAMPTSQNPPLRMPVFVLAIGNRYSLTGQIHQNHARRAVSGPFLHIRLCIVLLQVVLWSVCNAAGVEAMGWVGCRWAPPLEDMCGPFRCRGALVISMPHSPWYAPPLLLT